ncbi:6457_t:CDS:2 [Dentiscutata heterogama]|uniref:6457_t:CDS:1 n=1 Tax=Dentiscutata heterogama TaxID=1316150 RepID=A0ACA9KFR0_9GLOM|nr:6457_t:CDS:2 [Dentiscutata heterogama]
MQEIADFLGLDFDLFPVVSRFDRKLLNKYNLADDIDIEFEISKIKGEILTESDEFKLIKSTYPINTHGRVNNGLIKSYSIDRTTMIQWITNDNSSDIPESALPFERQELLNSTRRILGHKQEWDYN